MISLQKFLGLLGIHAFVNFASAGDIIQLCQDLPPSIRQGQYVSVIKNDTGRATFSRGNCRSWQTGDATRVMSSH